ncbi:prephenate dehydratase [Desulfohalobium retbaense]|uniref:Bifunctional chorismate mutase/prephenate dehydratase n=1 Tax=Desulfohalobium retbaense (strain ATCC 49708 / DSM 5692 / JCM 16813 / HR100) TaxID=485915 RepID=C8WZE3_DESRD|nr:prephenate dehydratase [Desulfohalobium retbaense]ACV67418.1 chorismate mutase [Desulfohalobium retbaense DSM 5692]
MGLNNQDEMTMTDTSTISLETLRDAIDGVDQELLHLLNRRAQLSLQVGEAKSTTKGAIFKPFREKAVLERLSAHNPGPLPQDHLESIYREILSSSRALQRPQRVVYLGPEGTFSYFAGVHALGGSAEFHDQPTLEDVFHAVSCGRAELGIIPLENSLQGTVGQSLDLFLMYEVFIQAEVFCRISHSLLSCNGDKGGITTVYSHPQALQQCGGWLRQHLPQAKVVPVESTAAAAARVKNASEAAIGHSALAGLYQLQVVASHIEDLPENWTRFLVIGRGAPPAGNRDKTSLLFSVPDKPGALAGVLNLLAREGVNMRKLESRPMRGERWKYVFFADLECDLGREEYTQLLQALEANCHSFRVLGSYPNGQALDMGREE